MSNSDILEIFKILCTIATAFISAFALIKVNKIDNQDRIRRSLWAFEQYLLSVGKCMENPNEKNMEEYQSYCSLYKIYVNEDLRVELDKIDVLLIENNKLKVKQAVNELTKKYSKIYDMEKFSPKRKRSR